MAALPDATAAAPAWSLRLSADLAAHDQAANDLIAALSIQQLNWQPAPGAWSIGQCLEHLCITNEAYLPPIAAALNNKPHAPVAEIVPGWLGGWFIQNLVEPSGKTKRVPAPGKIRPGSRVEPAVLHRFLSSNQACRRLILRASENDVNRIRFWNPFIPGLRFTAGTGLQIIVSHERRHLLQARRVKEAAGFPG
jgi:hypothetical protein